MTQAPWRQVDVGGELERAEQEFLHTNGAGAYCMSTLALLHSRRQHGLLVAALDPPLKRHVIVSHADVVVTTIKRSYRLSSYRFPGIAPTPGYRSLRVFSQDPLPRFSYRLGKSDFDISLALVRGQNALIMGFRWLGKNPVRVSMRPLLAMRPIDILAREHGAMMQRVSLRQGGVEIQPVANLPPLIIKHPGVFMGSPDWWRRFEYAEDRRSGETFEEDLWTPGTVEFELAPQQQQYVTLALERLPELPADQCFEEARQHLLQLDPGEERALAVRALSIAADQFRADLATRPAIIAGYPMLAEATRDTLVALPGLYLTAGRSEAAKHIVRGVIGLLQDGLLSQGRHEDGTVIPEVTADGSLWLFDVAERLARQLGTQDAFLREELYPCLQSIYARVVRTPDQVIWRRPNGLIVNTSLHSALTWMDSRSHGEIQVPRRGIAIELQALWSAALRTLAAFAAEYGDATLAQRLQDERRKLIGVFKSCFWCEATNYPFDCLDPSGDDNLADAAIRPNAVVALAVEPDLFDSWQAIRILEVAKQQLLTSRGLRTLDPNHPAYVGHYDPGLDERHTSYHRGAVWPFLLGAYARAALRVRPDDFELQVDLRDILEVCADGGGPVLGHVAQVAGGEPPHHAGGCPAQAWSTAELLRSLAEDLEL
ncbi:MAG TPA: amylo-alpha-1,6-glucosidase [Polyangiaceae bacterium]|nr:amylo-alpha-1,6-glucosidase [Polyangiaceae bacterium]